MTAISKEQEGRSLYTVAPSTISTVSPPSSIVELISPPIDNGSSNSPKKQQEQQQELHQKQIDDEYKLAAYDCMREELLQLRRQIGQMKEVERRRLQQHDCSIIHHDESSNLIPRHRHRKVEKEEEEEEQQEQKGNIVSELLFTLRRPFSFSNNGLYGNQRDHLSNSERTADNRGPGEPNSDIESHPSTVVGLPHRSPGRTTATIGTTTTTNININISTKTSSSLKTQGTENLTDYSLSSKDDIDDIDNDDDDDDEDLVAEAQVLIGGGDSHCGSDTPVDDDDSHCKHKQLPQMTFCQSLTDRAGWLIGLLVFQSLSSFILARNESLLQRHAFIVQFLTMLVGAGGNAGNQASVGVIRGIAVGSIHSSNVWKVLRREFAMGVALSILLGLAGLVRAKVFLIPWMATIVITVCLFMIVMISVVIGSILPLCMQFVGIDPAHSSTTIQVVMDITGVLITVNVSSLLLDSGFHDWLTNALS